MNIDSVNSRKFSYDANSESKSKTSDYSNSQLNFQSQLRSDRLELSSEARNLNLITSKLQSGFYDKPEILNETARKINNAFPPEI